MIHLNPSTKLLLRLQTLQEKVKICKSYVRMIDCGWVTEENAPHETWWTI